MIGNENIGDIFALVQFKENTKSAINGISKASSTVTANHAKRPCFKK